MAHTDLATILDTLTQSSANLTNFSESWSQGRSAFGGLSTALAVTAMRKKLLSPQPMRSLMVSFIAPVPPGDVVATATIQRQGKNVTQLAAEISTNGQIALQAMGVFGNPREALRLPALTEFSAPPRGQGVPFASRQPLTPRFLEYFEGYWVDGGMPFSGTRQRHVGIWVKHKHNLDAYPTEKLVAICDMPPPVILSFFDQAPVPASSLSWSLEFVVPPETIRSDWFYLDYVVESAADGYSQQSGKVFDETGQLCALSRQCMVYFG